jgi:hypothetical protein
MQSLGEQMVHSHYTNVGITSEREKGYSTDRDRPEYC